ncbi:MAG: hypothetical protein ACM3ON_00105 [Chloroflexota bacterium]
MKRIAWVAVMIMMLAAGAYAEQAEQTGQKPQLKPMPGQQMQMGGMRHGVMGDMQGYHVMMHDYAEIMTGILSIQEKIISGVNPSEKEALLKEISLLKGRLEQTQRTCCMQMGTGMGQQPAIEGMQPQDSPQKDAPHQHVH